jgi:PKD repeat protein
MQWWCTICGNFSMVPAPRPVLALAFALALSLVSCGKDGNPVALPTDPGNGNTGGGSQLTVTITADTAQAEAGSTTPTPLTISAVFTNGVPGGASATVSTSLGSLGVDASGKPVQLLQVPLVNGKAVVQFLPGDKVGTANILATVGTAVGKLNLPIVAPPAAPVADFDTQVNGLSVIFTDKSANSPATWHWDFGDKTSSSEKSPQHTYAAPGTYSVTLTVVNSGGQSSKTVFVTVSLGNPPVADFDFQVSGSQVNFIDKSKDATSWAWGFGDGQTSTQRNPVHTYAAPGQYTVVLVATNAAGSNSTSKAVKIEPGAPPVADFSFTITGQQVNFVDKSTGSPTAWLWDFGDGNTSTAQNPVHTYPAPGAYTVVLTVSNGNGFSKSSQVVAIQAGKAPVAAFDFAVSNNQVNFVDKSTGGPTAWSWSFGDGGTSSQQNPIHVYSSPGNYTVTLTVSNASGSSSASQVVAITPPSPPQAAFTWTVNGLQANFLDKSSGSPTSWTWNFGDGSTVSGVQNPVHVYAAAGSYTVTLTAGNANGTSSVAQVVTVK